MAYIHIDDELVPHLELLIDCVKLNGTDIDNTIKKITEDTKLMETCLEDNFLGFKLHSKKVRDEYEKAVVAEIAKSEEVWDKCADMIDKTRPKIETITTELQVPLQMLCRINNELDDMSMWKLEKLIECIDKFYKMPADEKALFAKLLKET